VLYKVDEYVLVIYVVLGLYSEFEVEEVEDARSKFLSIPVLSFTAIGYFKIGLEVISECSDDLLVEHIYFGRCLSFKGLWLFFKLRITNKRVRLRGELEMIKVFEQRTFLSFLLLLTKDKMIFKIKS